MEERKYEVDIDLANKAKAGMTEALGTGEARVLNRIGAFASLYDLRFPEYREPVLVTKTEEPGSKQLLAFALGRVEGICRDMINHLVNDCVVMGARPLAVQDAIICGKLDEAVVGRVVRALAEACRENECALTGGETSEQPGVLAPGAFVLTSSIVGIAERSSVIDGSRIEIGDTVIGLESSGPHTNGYTLIRRLLAEDPGLAGLDLDGVSFIEAVMEPHRPYYRGLKGLFPTGELRGLAHITGGGIAENLDRILPPGCDARVDLSCYRVPKVFSAIRDIGRVSDAEMLRTFNLGVGLAAVVAPANAEKVIAHFAGLGYPAHRIGEIIAGSRCVRTVGEIRW